MILNIKCQKFNRSRCFTSESCNDLKSCDVTAEIRCIWGLGVKFMILKHEVIILSQEFEILLNFLFLQ